MSSRVPRPLLALALSAALAPARAVALTPEDKQAIIQIEAQRLPVAALDSFLTHADPLTRARAVRALGRQRAPEALERLRTAAADPSPALRAEAAFALGLTPGSERDLIDLLDTDPVPAVRAAAAEALGQAGSPAAVTALLAAMEEQSKPLRPAVVAPAASRALGRMASRGVPLDRTDIIEALIDELRRADAPSRRAAAFALARIKPRGLGPELQRALADAALREPDADTQAGLVRVVGGLGGALPSSATARLQDEVLARAIVDPDVGVRVAAARASAAAGWPGVARLLNDPSPAVRLEAIAGVGQVKSLDRERLLRPLIDAGDDIRDEEDLATVRALRVVEAAAALDALGATGLLSSALPWIDPARPIRIREAAIRHTKDVGVLRTIALDDGDGPVRVAAAARLVALEPKKADLMPLLGAFDTMVAAVALDQLAEKVSAEDEARLIKLVQDNTEPDLIAAGAKALVRLYGGEKPLVKKPAEGAAALLPKLHGSGAAPVRAQGRELAAALGAKAPPAWHGLVSAPVGEVEQLRSARIITSVGEIVVELYPEDAPVTVWTWGRLAETGWFNGMRFHRVVPEFVVQGGDPRGDGSGGPGWTLPDELSPTPYAEGVLGMALAGPDTGGSQWFVTLSPQPHLDGNYTAFGKVVSGMHVLHRIVPGDRIERVIVERTPPPAG